MLVATNDVRFVDYHEADLQLLQRFLLSTWNKFPIESIDNHDTFCFLAMKENIPIGFVWGFRSSTSALFPMYLYVDEPYRHQGIGSKLMLKLIETFPNDAIQIYYEKHLHKFYQNLGFETNAHIEVAVLPNKAQHAIYNKSDEF